MNKNSKKHNKYLSN